MQNTVSGARPLGVTIIAVLLIILLYFLLDPNVRNAFFRS